MKTQLLILFAAFCLLSCSKTDFVEPSDAKLFTSTGELDFDTLFTSTGSITRLITIFNQSPGKLRIDRISLRGGENSFFRINADGRSGAIVENLEIDRGDSIYVFVSAIIDPSDKALPFIVEDTLDISYASKVSHVSLKGWGQNAYFLQSQVVLNDTTWTNERPIVIYGGLVVARNATLHIQAGSRIYLHADAPLIVDGTLLATGEQFDSTRILFRGDRLDEYYNNLPASWPGIYFTENSTENMLRHVDIRYAYQGLVTQAPADGPDFKVQLQQSVIDNCYDAAILAVNSSIRAVNCLISNSGKNVILVNGGNYSFIHCTNVAIATAYIPHKQPVLTVADFLRKENVVESAPLNASFVNCIFWGAGGGVDDEVVVLRESNLPFGVTFNNCMWKLATQPDNTQMESMIANTDPDFTDAGNMEGQFDFHLSEGSPAINAGTNAGISEDLEGSPRTNVPDIGAYESTF